MTTVMATRKVNVSCVVRFSFLLLGAFLLVKWLQTKSLYSKQLEEMNSKEQVAHSVKASNQIESVAKSSSLPCTLGHDGRHDGVILLTTTNAGFQDMTTNMLESIRRVRICPNITIIAEDEQSYKYLTDKVASPGVHIQKTDSGVMTSDRLRVYGRVYIQFVKKRARYILNFLNKGYDVLFTDVDTFWFQDPFPDFRGNFDIAMRQEAPPSSLTPVFCNGFGYYRATENTLAVVREWVRLMSTTHKKTMDKDVLNLVIKNRKPAVRMKSLDSVKYPDGRVFRDKGWVKKRANTTVVLHLSSVFGHNSKLKKLKDNGLWLI
ncbi:UDP-D-xylose:L-fucose alpha-1,3-D-xylosyltransferase-like [Acanthaster planci]|uniref:UDP-D-xylose:L-fucose alpha-1,3-D-xylosyltransferase-like n=1 Tax=Acanthaster planci TaxID=133434 RepID=A0A8B7Y7B9_ACAPL|nr:UDP-D-xylose:L-fucose alpha-1,3-D-xylosyltransferase-like [Acanthaster planci]XP_022089111.1 UDP-D-xylose:L-fucose alpha-1,3-D-xylosyltransferase-like [Acanthaster planci]XP_022089112.1 UDP-D-xylose:L-fucose alpha-1,3-D-xylosyltransferase-like [Acanthaster planci]XP_022089113.1 UDP-D-xylose:L-fucose alpha-1,3-D-xylosyltransferase-like [Acanthaster planci]